VHIEKNQNKTTIFFLPHISSSIVYYLELYPIITHSSKLIFESRFLYSQEMVAVCTYEYMNKEKKNGGRNMPMYINPKV
jgi:hypothetical protein